MKKQDIAELVARHCGLSCAEAADRVDGVVHQILAGLRRGKKTSLPGLGTFSPDAKGRAVFEREESCRGAAKS
jgi:nucleoid DNA-binding protein